MLELELSVLLGRWTKDKEEKEEGKNPTRLTNWCYVNSSTRQFVNSTSVLLLTWMLRFGQ